MPKYIVLNGRKNQNIWCLRAHFFGAFGTQKHPISLYFLIPLNFYAQFGSKMHFLIKNAKFFLKSALGDKTLGASRQKLCPHRSRKTVPGGVGQQVRNPFKQNAQLDLILRFLLILDLPIIRSVCSWSLFTSYRVVFVVLVGIEY